MLQHLHTRLAEALQGVRRTIFIAGEPGIGKTAVVEAFAAQVAAATQVHIAREQYVEQYGAGEAYMLILEVLGQLCRGADAADIIAVLRQQAPT